MSRKKKYRPKNFESLKNGESFEGSQGKNTPDVFSRIYQSMLESDAFMDLTHKQQVLYLFCKLQFYGKRKPERDYPEYPELKGEDKFYFNWALVSDKYRLYPKSSNKNFSVDMHELIDHGFIELIACGKATRTKNIYKYSDRWKSWKSEK